MCELFYCVDFLVWKYFFLCVDVENVFEVYEVVDEIGNVLYWFVYYDGDFVCIWFYCIDCDVGGWFGIVEYYDVVIFC